MALHSGLVFKPTLPLTSTPRIFTLPLTATLSLPPLTSLLFLQTTRSRCCESAAANRPFLIINHSWLHSRCQGKHSGVEEEGKGDQEVLVQLFMVSHTVSSQQQAHRRQGKEKSVTYRQQGKARHLLDLLSKTSAAFKQRESF